MCSSNFTHAVFNTTLFFPQDVETLIFTCTCIVNIIPNYNQQDATFLDLFISTDALHVSSIVLMNIIKKIIMIMIVSKLMYYVLRRIT